MTSPIRKALLLSAYEAESHRKWRNTIEAGLKDEIDFDSLTLPGRYFSWRIRGNPLSWGPALNKLAGQRYEFILATSMVDIATIKGLNKFLAHVPAYYYFHENQFAYPPGSGDKSHVEPKMVQLYGAMASDKVFFNSYFNRDSFFDGVEKLLGKMPDHVPKGILKDLQRKSTVLPVPISLSNPASEKSKENTVQIIWNHRWEFDKGPNRLMKVMEHFKSCGEEVVFHILGQKFRNSPSAFERIKTEFSNIIGHFGYIQDREEYKKILRQGDFVLSTAIHEFQGTSILEAVSAGCVPVVPDRLSYQEIFSPLYRYPSSINDQDQEARSAADKIKELIATPIEVPKIYSYSWAHLKEEYLRQLS